MNSPTAPRSSSEDYLGSHYALQVALQTMKERCQQLQARLAAVEQENVCLRVECGRENNSTPAIQDGTEVDKTTVQILQEKVQQLTKQKSQLTHHIFMVASENRQLWNRLSRLTRTNESLGNHLTKISDTLKQHPQPAQISDMLRYSFKDGPKSDNNAKQALSAGNGEQSLEEISLKLINSIMLEKSELEQQYAEMVEMQSNSDVDLQNIGFTYPEDTDSDSLEQLKQHDIRLSQTKDALLVQQVKLKTAIENLRKMKRDSECKSCCQNAKKKMCQTGTQFDTDNSLRGHGATQTSLISIPEKVLENHHVDVDNETMDKFCPLCGAHYGRANTFAEFHEHVLNHFAEDQEPSMNDFELIH